MIDKVDVFNSLTFEVQKVHLNRIKKFKSFNIFDELYKKVKVKDALVPN
jgi:hypothetical protein